MKERFTLTPEQIANLPVTDLKHVVKEINTDLHVQSTIRQCYAKQRDYMREYNKKRRATT